MKQKEDEYMNRILKAALALILLSCGACARAPELTALETAAKYLEEGEYGKAIESYSALISESSDNRLDPDTVTSAYIGLSETYMKQGDTGSAVKTLVDAILKYSENNDEEMINNMTDLNQQLDKVIEDKLPYVICQENLEISDIGYVYDPDFTEDTYPDGNKFKIYRGTLYCYISGPGNAAGILNPISSTDLISQFSFIQDEIPKSVEWNKNNSSDIVLSAVPYTSETSFDAESTWGTADLCLIAVDENLDYTGFAIIRVKVPE